jgi:hypothetical protein
MCQMVSRHGINVRLDLSNGRHSKLRVVVNVAWLSLPIPEKQAVVSLSSQVGNLKDLLSNFKFQKSAGD